MSAVISGCGKYRYWLERKDATLTLDFPARTTVPAVVWALANPSTADAEIDDPTVRKARGFTERLGYERFIFVNCFAYRSTKPSGLLGVADPVGPDNHKWVALAVASAPLVIAAWGNAIHPKLRHHVKPFLETLRAAGPVHCLGYTADRSPRHPLMLPYSTPLELCEP